MDEITNALFAASRQGNVPVLEEIFLIKKELDVRDERGYTPLIIAAYNNQPGATLALLKAGANPDAADASGNTALMGACFKGHAAIVKILLENGATVDACHGNGGTARTRDGAGTRRMGTPGERLSFTTPRKRSGGIVAAKRGEMRARRIAAAVAAARAR